MPARVLLRNSLLEAIMTAGLVLVIVSAVRWVIGDGPIARNVDAVHLKVALVAVLAALTVLVLIVSPGGRRSGAHLNPAVTIALWQMRAFPARAVLPYVVAQLAGSIAGAGLARLLWGPAIAGPPVRFGVVAPGEGWRGWQVGLVEAACLVVVTLVIGYFLAHPTSRLRAALPYVLAGLTFLMAAGLGTLSGASVNPARQVGPALWAGEDAYLAWYLFAPIVGALVGARIHLHLVRRPLTTYKLSGDPSI